MDKAKKENKLTVLWDTEGTSFLRDDESLLRQVWGQPQLQSKVYNYICDHSHVQQVVRDLLEETMHLPQAIMATSIDQHPILRLLTSLSGAKCVVDIGTFTGISALQFALTIPNDGHVITLDKSDEHLKLAKKYWEKAGVKHKIESRIGDALDIMNDLVTEGYTGKIDFAFLDVDKRKYDDLYEKLLTMMNPGGLIVFDNVLLSGKVADELFMGEITCAMRALNKKLYNDKRIDFTLIPAADGLAVCRIRAADTSTQNS